MFEFRLGLNPQTIPARAATNMIEDVVWNQHGQRYMLTFDFKDDFHQFPLHPDTQPYTSIAMTFGRYEFTRVPQGWVDGPAACKTAMEESFHNMRVPVGPLLIYMDDVTLGSQDFWEHLRHLVELFERCQQYKSR